MTLSEELTAAATEVLIYHAATSTSGCLCGGVGLGQSIAEHQAKLVIAAVLRALPESEVVLRIFDPEVRAALQAFRSGRDHPLIDQLRAKMRKADDD